MRITVEIIWTLGERRKNSEVYCADSQEELEKIRQYFIDEKKKLINVPTAGQEVWFEASDGSHPYKWDDAKKCLNHEPYAKY